MHAEGAHVHIWSLIWSIPCPRNQKSLPSAASCILEASGQRNHFQVLRPTFAGHTGIPSGKHRHGRNGPGHFGCTAHWKCCCEDSQARVSSALYGGPNPSMHTRCGEQRRSNFRDLRSDNLARTETVGTNTHNATSAMQQHVKACARDNSIDEKKKLRIC
jgi:hypothetical protein